MRAPTTAQTGGRGGGYGSVKWNRKKSKAGKSPRLSRKGVGMCAPSPRVVKRTGGGIGAADLKRRHYAKDAVVLLRAGLK